MLTTSSLLYTAMCFVLRLICVEHAVWHYSSRTFYALPCDMWLMCDSGVILTLSSQNKEKKKKKKIVRVHHLKLWQSHLYNIFAIYFLGNFSLLKSLFSAISSFSYYLTSIFILPSNSAITFFVFSKSFFLDPLYSILLYLLSSITLLLFVPYLLVFSLL